MAFLCIITPIFDPALPCFKLLVEALLRQTSQDYIHVAISNGESSLSHEYIKTLDKKFIYDEIPAQKIKNFIQLIENLSARRAYALRTYDAERFQFFDADLRLFRENYIEELKNNHAKAELIISKTINRGTVLPIPPYDTVGQIDISNYSFSRKIAKSCPYPTDYNPFANDFRFFRQMAGLKSITLPDPYAEKDGNNKNTYLRTSEQYR